jgi:hypothetical protein
VDQPAAALIISIIVIGLVACALARLIVPRRQDTSIR